MSKLSKDSLKTIGIKTAGTLAIPVVFVVVVFIICGACGVMVLNSSSLFADFVCYAGIITLTTFALSINLGSGRFDFSLGSMATLSAVAGSKLTYLMLGGAAGSGIVMLILCLVIGLACGAVSGALYVLLRIPPIITSLGVALIFEAITFIITNGTYMTTEVQNSDMTYFRNSWYLPLIIILVVLALIYFIYDRTKFGYNYKALREGQKVAANIGINEVSNAVWCYVICGGLMGIVGFLQAVRNTGITTDVLDFGSISIMFSAFLPMFIGGFIGRFSNDKLGYLLAGLSMSLLNALFAQLSLVGMMNSSTRSIIEAVLLVVFLIFLNNEQTCKDLVTGRLFKKWYKRFKNWRANRKNVKKPEET